MAQYIDKSALVAEIEKRKHRNLLNEGAFEEDIDILSFLNTLEGKEVDIDKEIERYCKSKEFIDALYTVRLTELIAKHFFELALSLKNS